MMIKPKYYKANGNPELPNNKKPFFGIGAQTFNDDFSWIKEKRGTNDEEFIKEQMDIERVVLDETNRMEENRRKQEEIRRMEDERMEQERVQQQERMNYPTWHDYDNDNVMDDFW